MAVCPSSQETVCPSSQVLVAAMSSVKQEIPASAPPIKALPATGNLFGYLTFEYVTFGYLDSFLFFGWDSMGSLSTLSNSCQLRQRMTLTSPSRKCWWCEWKRHLGLLIHGEKHIVSQKYPKNNWNTTLYWIAGPTIPLIPCRSRLQRIWGSGSSTSMVLLMGMLLSRRCLG